MKKNTNPLRRAREQMGLTRKDAASLMGVHSMSFYFWERGEKLPKKENLIKIKHIFKVDPIEMLGI